MASRRNGNLFLGAARHTWMRIWRIFLFQRGRERENEQKTSECFLLVLSGFSGLFEGGHAFGEAFFWLGKLMRERVGLEIRLIPYLVFLHG